MMAATHSASAAIASLKHEASMAGAAAALRKIQSPSWQGSKRRSGEPALLKQTRSDARSQRGSCGHARANILGMPREAGPGSRHAERLRGYPDDPRWSMRLPGLEGCG
jgi:hypothetical protein